MLLEQYMTPVNIIIAVILVVLGYLAYKKYQKSNGSYEHAGPLGNVQTDYKLVKTVTGKIDIAPEINSIVASFNSKQVNYDKKPYNYSMNLGSYSSNNIIHIRGTANKVTFLGTGNKTNFNPAFSFSIIDNRIFITKFLVRGTGMRPFTMLDITDNITSIQNQLRSIINENVTFDVSIINPNKNKNNNDFNVLQIKVVTPNTSTITFNQARNTHKIDVKHVISSNYIPPPQENTRTPSDEMVSDEMVSDEMVSTSTV
jgi:hypothetical protein